MIQIIIRMTRIPHVLHLFAMKPIILEVNAASLSIYTEKKEEKI